MKKTKRSLKEPQWLVVLILAGVGIYFMSMRSHTLGAQHHQVGPIFVKAQTTNQPQSAVTMASSKSVIKRHKRDVSSNYPPGTMPP
jgi:hypothetical protein